MTTTDLLRQKINLETAMLPWTELLRHFAGGNVIAVKEGLDLVDIAVHMANDNAKEISALLAAGNIIKVSDVQAQSWLEQDISLWVVVVKPWVLVQPKSS